MKLTGIKLEQRETTAQIIDYNLLFTFDGGDAQIGFNYGADALSVAREFEWLAMTIRNTVEVDRELKQ